MTVVAFILRWVLLALAVVLAAWVTPDVDFSGGPLSALVVAALIAAANVVAQLALRWLPSPDNVLALAALTLVVNGCVVWLASVLTTRLRIDGFVAAVTFALMVTVFSVALGWAIQRVLDRFDRSTVGETA
ncbi:phage holin family protein [Nocardioides sp. S-58]|uniref:Phage holin family protein n=1 Tax=Nocardioides renjunii TaxID=3095075 RepID=A0ABU5KAP2_9ACTN|nr:phage holin family protein [Nocardioides sp. S-58]MDZ5662037.1 phage holin family protein [Nocardioides sp. S-58]